MSMQGRKNKQARIKAMIDDCKECGAHRLAEVIGGEHEAHRMLRKKPMKFQFNQMTASSNINN